MWISLSHLLILEKLKLIFLVMLKNHQVLYSLETARLIDIVNISTGFTTTSNIRNIKIVNKDGDSNYFDLLRFFRFGDKKNNPLLSEGDNIIVDKIDKIIYIDGHIKYPGTYEYKTGERVIDLIELAGGLRDHAREDSIEVISFDSAGKNQISRYFDLSDLKQNNLLTQKQDQIIIREIPDYYINRYITITGFVKYPGFYKIIKDQTTLFDIINEAGGFKRDASLSEATLFRSQGISEIDNEFERIKIIPRTDMTDDEYDYIKAKSRERKGRVIVDFDLLFNHKDMSENTILKKGDIINST